MPSQRLDAIDALRGLALVWMTLFHFAFDLNHFGFLRQDFYNNSFWTVQRTLILGSFLFCAGVGQAVALHQGQPWGRFWRRWGQVAGCALLVTAGSYLMFPRSFIYFGVLHGIALMLILVRLTAGWGRWLWLLGALAIVGKFMAVQFLTGSDWEPLFNARALNWLGWVTQKPITEDYVPLLPWLGLMWWGAASGTWLLKHQPGLLAWRPPWPGQALALLGRWSLGYYLLHQPVLIGLLSLLVWAGG